MVRTFAVFVTALVAGVLAVGVLGGCGGTPDAAPPPSSSAPPSASATPTAPVMPDAARQNTKAGAVAFVKFYIAAFNHAQTTGDVSTLKTLGAKQCVSCNAVLRAIRRTYSAGGHSVGGDWIVEGQESRLSVGKMRAVYIAGHFEPSTNYTGAHGQPSHLKGAKIIASFFVRFSDGWKVMRWTRA